MRAQRNAEYIEVVNDVGWKVEISYPGYTSVFDQHENTTKTQLPPVITNYCCRSPNCNSKKFESNYGLRQNPFLHESPRDMVIGPRQEPSETVRVIQGYSCPSCSATFNDPAKWSKSQPPQIVPPVATEKPNYFESAMDDETKAKIQEITAQSGLFQ